MDKLHKYAQKYCDGEIITSANGNSYYYHFNNGKFILRISDHIGRNSDGKASIIIDKNGYLLHNHNTGSVYIETYENIKKLIRSLAVFSSVNVKMETTSLGEMKNEINTLKQQIDSLTKKNLKLGETNTRINNENVTHKSQVKSLTKEIESLRNEMLNHPIRFWFKLFFRHRKAKK